MSYELYNEDCRVVSGFIRSGSVQAIVTSPPYDSMRSYGGEAAFNDDVLRELAPDFYRILSDNGVVVWVIGDETVKGDESTTSHRHVAIMKEAGFKLHDTMIYEKHNFASPSTNRYHQIFEYMFVFVKNPPYFNPIKDVEVKHAGETAFGANRFYGKDGLLTRKKKTYNQWGMRTNIWRIITSGARPNERKYKHEAKFPEALVYDHIQTWTQPGDVVYDPFTGSGTTGKVALENNRLFIGAEIAKGSYTTAITRIKEQTGCTPYPECAKGLT